MEGQEEIQLRMSSCHQGSQGKSRERRREMLAARFTSGWRLVQSADGGGDECASRCPGLSRSVPVGGTSDFPLHHCHLSLLSRLSRFYR
jgi:hypothetical protein